MCTGTRYLCVSSHSLKLIYLLGSVNGCICLFKPFVHGAGVTSASMLSREDFKLSATSTYISCGSKGSQNAWGRGGGGSKDTLRVVCLIYKQGIMLLYVCILSLSRGVWVGGVLQLCLPQFNQHIASLLTEARVCDINFVCVPIRQITTPLSLPRRCAVLAQKPSLAQIPTSLC